MPALEISLLFSKVLSISEGFVYPNYLLMCYIGRFAFLYKLQWKVRFILPLCSRMSWQYEVFYQSVCCLLTKYLLKFEYKLEIPSNNSEIRYGLVQLIRIVESTCLKLLTHTILASFMWDIGKQCKTISDAAKRGI